jgi:hypothetical protein
VKKLTQEEQIAEDKVKNLMSLGSKKKIIKVYENDQEVPVVFDVIYSNFHSDSLDINSYVKFSKLSDLLKTKDEVNKLIKNPVLKLKVIPSKGDDAFISNFKSSEKVAAIRHEVDVYLLIHFSLIGYSFDPDCDFFLIKISREDIKERVESYMTKCNEWHQNECVNENEYENENEVHNQRNHRDHINVLSNSQSSQTISKLQEKLEEKDKQIDILNKTLDRFRENEINIEKREQELRAKFETEMNNKIEEKCSKYKLFAERVTQNQLELRERLSKEEENNRLLLKYKSVYEDKLHRNGIPLPKINNDTKAEDLKKNKANNLPKPTFKSLVIDRSIGKFEILRAYQSTGKVKDIKIDEFLLEEVYEPRSNLKKCIDDDAEEYKEKYNSLRERVNCISCHVNERNVYFYDCQHVVYCMNCLPNAQTKPGKGKKKVEFMCPLCRKGNKQALVLFLS